MFIDILAITGGFALMTLGAYVLVYGASNLARAFGVTEMIIGATVVALGTSLPELIAVIVASAQGKAGIGLGNIVGSNIINVLGVLGTGVVIMPITVKGSDGSEVNPVVIIAFVGASLYLLLCLLFRQRISRIDGLILVTGFVVYSWLSYSVKPGQ